MEKEESMEISDSIHSLDLPLWDALPDANILTSWPLRHLKYPKFRPDF